MPKKMTKSETSTPEFTPTTTNVEEAIANTTVPFVTDDATLANITLPGSAFFDQELGEVIFNKLMKAPVKDYQVLLRLSKLGKTINTISVELTKIRDAITKDCGLDSLTTSLTPETLNSTDYQAKTQAFGKLIHEYVFSKRISLAPLGTLTLDLTNPDGHAKAFLEGSSLSTDDIDMLDTFGIVKVVFPEEQTESATPDVLVPNPEE